MDEATREALADIKKDVREGFAGIKGDIGQLVTKGEFNATVQRLDNQDRMHEQNILQLAQQFQEHQAQTQINMAHVSSEDSATRKLVKEQVDEIKSSQRWAIGITVPAVGIFVAIISFAIDHFK